MKEYIKRQVNEKISALVAVPSIDGKIIADINDIAFKHKSNAGDICEVIVSRALTEQSAFNKLKVLSSIDSIIKNMGNEYIQYLSPHIFRVFEEAYVISDEENKINLFKLFYTWKYFLDVNVLESLNSRFNFKEFKAVLQREKPGFLEKYDKFNEGIKENMLKEKEKDKEKEKEKEKTNRINPAINSNNLISTNINSNITPSSTSAYISSNLISYSSIPSQFSKKDIKESFLEDIKGSSSKSSSLRKRSREDLFSSHSSSPRISRESSDDDKDKDKFSHKKEKYHGWHLKDTRNKGSNKRVSEFADAMEKTRDIEIPKKKKAYDAHTHDAHDSHDRRPKPNKDTTNTTTNITTTDASASTTTTLLRPTFTPPVKVIEPEDEKKLSQQEIFMKTFPFLINPQIASLLSQIVNTGASNIPVGPISMNRTETSTSVLLNKPHEKEKELFTQVCATYPAFNSINSFINQSTSSINNTSAFFSSISKFFYDTVNEYSPIQDLIRDHKDQIKSKIDILKLRDSSKESYREVLKKSIESLSSDLKNFCSICGFRTKLYSKFVEHLDIHFHINYIKRSSQKKVLYRKESLDKNSWIRGEITPNISNELSKHAYTLNSVLFYQNDADHIVSNKKDVKSEENMQDNEQLIFPLQPNEEVTCVYCGEEFRKAYINKFHYWFYVNVFKFNKDEIPEGYLSKEKSTGEVLIHENCMEEFFKIMKFKQNIRLLKEKRNRQFETKDTMNLD